jgi:AAA domain
MLIKGISIEGIGRFSGKIEVEGFGDGVNVLAAGNEAGKSTLFRAVRACLFNRHDSRTQDIRELGTEGSQLPAIVQIAFAKDGREYLVRKAFLRSHSATLSENGREIARAKQADEAIWDLLGIRPGSGRTIDDGAFGLLWVGQRASFMAPALGPAASSQINAAIESEVGSLIGGERARRTIDAITAELRRNLTESEQRPRNDGPLYKALAEVERWRAAEQESNGKLTALDGQFHELAQHRRRHGELVDLGMTRQAEAELLAARNARAEAQAAAQDLRRYEAEAAVALAALEGAAQRLTQFQGLAARIDANRDTEAALAGTLPAHEAREQEARGTLVRTQVDIVEADAKLQAHSARERQLERLAGVVLQTQRKDELGHRLEGLEQAVEDLRELDAQLGQIEVKPKTVETLDDLDRQIAALDARLFAAAAQLSVEVKAAGAGKVRIGSIDIPDAYSAAIVAPTAIAVGELAVITVTPAAQPQQEERTALEVRRRAILESAGVVTVADAHSLLARRRDLEAARKGTLAQLKALNVGNDPEAAIGKVKDVLAEVDAAIAATMADTEDGRLPTLPEIEAQRNSLAQDRVLAEARRENLNEAQTRQLGVLEAAVVARSGVVSTLEQLRNRIAEDTALCPDGERAQREAALATQVTEAETAHETAAAMLSARRQGAPDANEIERRQARCERLEQAAANRAEELRKLERDIGMLTGQIQTAGGDGVGEALAAAREQRELAERQSGRLQERVEVLKLLRDTIAACLSEGRQRYQEPVRRHLRPFLNDLFPGAELELGEDFAIAGIRRDRAESFERLSDGTQEQIAVLVRLAMGGMLAEKGTPVPIILDDALVYSDDDRIGRMFDALNRAGRRQQIIVLTCRMRSFERLGGRTLRLA